jgi:hypothetical protein
MCCPEGAQGLDRVELLGQRPSIPRWILHVEKCKYMAGMWERENRAKNNPFTRVPEKQLEKRLLINSNVIQTRCQSQS